MPSLLRLASDLYLFVKFSYYFKFLAGCRFNISCLMVFFIAVHIIFFIWAVIRFMPLFTTLEALFSLFGPVHCAFWGPYLQHLKHLDPSSLFRNLHLVQPIFIDPSCRSFSAAFPPITTVTFSLYQRQVTMLLSDIFLGS